VIPEEERGTKNRIILLKKWERKGGNSQEGVAHFNYAVEGDILLPTFMEKESI